MIAQHIFTYSKYSIVTENFPDLSFSITFAILTKFCLWKFFSSFLYRVLSSTRVLAKMIIDFFLRIESKLVNSAALYNKRISQVSEKLTSSVNLPLWLGFMYTHHNGFLNYGFSNFADFHKNVIFCNGSQNPCILLHRSKSEFNRWKYRYSTSSFRDDFISTSSFNFRS